MPSQRVAKILADLEAYDRRSCREALTSPSDASPAGKNRDKRTFPRLFEKRTFDALEKAAERADDARERECLERAKWVVADLYIDQMDAAAYDAYAKKEANIAIETEGRPITFQDVEPRIANEPDAAVREILFLRKEYAIDRVLNGPLLKQALRRARAVRRLGFSGEAEMIDAWKGANFLQLRRLLSAFTQDTQDAHLEAIHAFAAEVVGHDPPIRYAHLQYLRRATDFDAQFPRENLLVACYETFRALGFDIHEAKNLHLDATEDERKDARSFCMSINAPHEVHVVLKPYGGREDYATLLHEFGHAWHAVHTDPKLPYALRQFPRSHALTETYAFLFENLAADPVWLKRYLKVGARKAAQIAQTQKVIDLLLLRRYTARLNYELDFFADPADTARNQANYAAHMTRYTGLTTTGFRYLSDMGPALECADYLRAWIAETQLRDYLEREYGEAWFLDPRAGEFLRGLWRRGESLEAEDLVREIGANPWDLSLLEAKYAGL